jgi:hypothetical protein
MHFCYPAVCKVEKLQIGGQFENTEREREREREITELYFSSKK